MPDEGGWVLLGESRIGVVPAHFLHAEGNFHFYDPRARILFTGDVGASMVAHEAVAEPITTEDALLRHISAMEGFHRRYMVSNKACRLWVAMIRPLVASDEITMLVPQHGRFFVGKRVILALLEWIESLSCGIDRFDQGNYRMPT
jgi:flavorubredoxin